MPEPKTLGRVDWMSRLKVWRVIWYKGAADIPAGDYPTKKEAEDALRELVARGNPGNTPEVTKWVGVDSTTSPKIAQRFKERAESRGHRARITTRAEPSTGRTFYTIEILMPEKAVKAIPKAPAEKGSLEQKANALLPMPPEEGPPLPRMFDLKWPWKK